MNSDCRRQKWISKFAAIDPAERVSRAVDDIVWLEKTLEDLKAAFEARPTRVVPKYTVRWGRERMSPATLTEALLFARFQLKTGALQEVCIVRALEGESS